MRIENKLTLSHLKENKGRTVITTLGIGVSVAMITAVFVAIASFLNLFGDMAILTFGDAHAKLYVDSAQVEKLRKDDRIDEIGFQLDKDDMTYQLSERESDRLGTGSVYVGDKTNIRQMITCTYDGKLPEKENEIAVEKKLIEDNKLDWKIGDTVTIPTGLLYYQINNEKSNLYGCGYYTKDMIFKNTANEKYKITAILHENHSTNFSYSILSCKDLTDLNHQNGAICASIKVKNLNYKSLDVIYSIIDDYDSEEYNLNKDYLEAHFAIPADGFLMQAVIPMTVIILLIIIIASVILIYNAFGMSLSERVRYLGMLASVGATKRQKKSSLYFEGLILGIFGIPIGMFAGIAGIGITLKAVGDKIISSGMFSDAADTVSMKVVVPLWAVIGIVLLSALTIFISSLIPAKKASKITPIDAIRQRNEIKVKKRSLRVPKIVRLIFGYEGELAYKNLNRNGRKSRIITVSIALSIVLFMSCNYFCQLFTQANSLENKQPYQLMAYTEYNSNAFDKLKTVKDIDDVYNVNSIFYNTADYENNNFTKSENLTGTYKDLFDSDVIIYFNILDDEHFNELCKANHIDNLKYYQNSIKVLLMNNISHNSGGNKVFNDKVIGTNFDCGYDNEFEIADLIEYDENNSLCNLNYKNSISAYLPMSTYVNNCVENIDVDGYQSIIGIETKHHESVKEELDKIADDTDISWTVFDLVKQTETGNTTVFVMEVFIYGFIALISLITIANIINTISTGIALRRKEFAMFKSVGTTPKGLMKITVLESVFYGLKSVVFAVPISLILSFVMNRTIGENTIPFEVNWLLYLIVILVVFGVIGITMLYSVAKLKKETIVQTLREDIV